MKCSDYLWKRIELDKELPDTAGPAEVQGYVRKILGKEEITSDTTGKYMNEWEAASIMGRDQKALLAKFNAGDRDGFNQRVIAQLKADDEYEARNGKR